MNKEDIITIFLLFCCIGIALYHVYIGEKTIDNLNETIMDKSDKITKLNQEIKSFEKELIKTKSKLNTSEAFGLRRENLYLEWKNNYFDLLGEHNSYSEYIDFKDKIEHISNRKWIDDFYMCEDFTDDSVKLLERDYEVFKVRSCNPHCSGSDKKCCHFYYAVGIEPQTAEPLKDTKYSDVKEIWHENRRFH